MRDLSSSLLQWLPKLFLGIQILHDLYIVLKGLSAKSFEDLKTIVAVCGLLLFMAFFVNAGIDSLFTLYAQNNPAEVGILMGSMTVPLGYHLTKLLVRRSVGKDRLGSEKERKFAAVMSILVYPTGAFLLFFASFFINELLLKRWF